jgi:hypothetical protein
LPTGGCGFARNWGHSGREVEDGGARSQDLPIGPEDGVAEQATVSVETAPKDISPLRVCEGQCPPSIRCELPGQGLGAEGDIFEVDLPLTLNLKPGESTQDGRDDGGD